MAKLVVFLQAFPNTLHPISKAILSTARALAAEKHLEAVGVLCCAQFSDALQKELKASGLDTCILYQNDVFHQFIPEAQAEGICASANDAEILLFPATPEGRTLSAFVAAKLETGVTADCTSLSFTEDGFLLQTRPAFSGNLFAGIVTKQTKPQIASLRFASPLFAVEQPTKIEIRPLPLSQKPLYQARWTDTLSAPKQECDCILAIGNGVKSKEDIPMFEAVAKKLGAELYASRALIDKGFLPKSRQIGLSGQSVHPKFMLTLGISGSVQFLAGLEEVQTLCSVNLLKDAPILKQADIPIVADLYAVATELLNT